MMVDDKGNPELAVLQLDAARGSETRHHKGIAWPNQHWGSVLNSAFPNPGIALKLKNQQTRM